MLIIYIALGIVLGAILLMTIEYWLQVLFWAMATLLAFAAVAVLFIFVAAMAEAAGA